MSHVAAAHHRTTRTSARDGSLTPIEKVLLAVLGVALFVIALTSGGSGSQPMSTTSILVENGDTVWTVARAHPIEGMSTAETADLILEMNGVDSPRLVAGQLLVVPVAQPAQALAMR